MHVDQMDPILANVMRLRKELDVTETEAKPAEHRTQLAIELFKLCAANSDLEKLLVEFVFSVVLQKL